ncbi:hypothetical protein V8J36_13470 [Frigidibacter sp. MR17.14]
MSDHPVRPQAELPLPASPATQRRILGLFLIAVFVMTGAATALVALF